MIYNQTKWLKQSNNNNLSKNIKENSSKNFINDLENEKDNLGIDKSRAATLELYDKFTIEYSLGLRKSLNQNSVKWYKIKYSKILPIVSTSKINFIFKIIN